MRYLIALFLLASSLVLQAAPIRANANTTNVVVGVVTNGQTLVASGTNTWIPISVSQLASNYTTTSVASLGTATTNLVGVVTTNLTNLVATKLGTNVLNAAITNNTAPFAITTNFLLNTYYTNGNQRATIIQAFDCTGAAAGVGMVGILLDQNGDGVFENTANSVGLPIAVVSIIRVQAFATLQPNAVICFTNISAGVGGGATNVVGGGQFTKW